MAKCISRGVLSLGLALLTTIGSAEEPMRTWTDQSGAYEVVAKLVSISEDGKTVSIELDDQQTVDVEFERLSRDDRRYVLRQKRLQSKRSASDRKRRHASPRRTVKLYGIDWHPSLDSAMAAGESSRSGADKPIMCFRVLGDLAGYM